MQGNSEQRRNDYLVEFPIAVQAERGLSRVRVGATRVESRATSATVA